ncbi:MAG: NAD(P)-binding protein, partial [Methanoregulaceae archaeon]|nr:NAD(P)-binding protein [Methanoregulaceae archaeon]
MNSGYYSSPVNLYSPLVLNKLSAKNYPMPGKKVIVVGAGPGGLTSAMILAHRGFSITVYEKENCVGGRNAPLKLGPYTFDTGPTFLMMKFILEEMFSEAGKDIAKYLEVRKIEPMYHLDYGDINLYPSTDV